VLDNFEHLLADAHLPGGTALLADIVRSAPEVTLLVTSRERLNLQGEQVFTAQGLPQPPAAAHNAFAKSRI
jgi:predicted ATPase